MTQATRLKISVIVLAYNCEETIGKCLESLLEQTAWSKYDKEILVIINGSKDKTVEIARKYPVEVQVYEAPLGHARAANVGYGLSRGDIIFPAFGDARYAPDFIELCADHLANDPKAGSAYGFDLQWSDGSFLSRYLEQARIIAKINYKPFSGWFYRRSDLQKLGLADKMYDEGVVGPDVKLAQQVKALGYTLTWEPNAMYWHGLDYNSFGRVFTKGMNVGVKLFQQLKAGHTYSNFFYSRVIGVGIYIVLIIASLLDLGWLPVAQKAGIIILEVALPYLGFLGLALKEVLRKGQSVRKYGRYILVSGLVNVVRYFAMTIGFFFGYPIALVRRHLPY